MAKKLADHLETILASPLFEGFAQDEALRLIGALEGEIMSCRAGTILAAAGLAAPRPGAVYLLLRGQVQYVRYGLHGEQRMIGYSLPGSVLGTPQALGGEESYHNALLAAGDCDCCAWARRGTTRFPGGWSAISCVWRSGGTSASCGRSTSSPDAPSGKSC